tara:strand:+ start:174 stop:1076 length:903 start_codon:yes stop_codon:yes gene_type:complete
MALEYGFTDKERDSYFLAKRVYSSFGRDNNDDFIMLYIYSDDTDLLLQNIMIPIQDVNFSEDGFIDINVGQHLRDAGFTEGNYRVVYKFMRRLAGAEQPVYVDDSGNVWDGEVVEKEVNGEIKYYSSTTNPGIDEKDSNEAVELFLKDFTYFIDDISTDRTELIIEVDENLKQEEYREDFESMNQLIEYKSLKSDDFGSIKFDTKEPYILEFDIDEKDRGFTQNMVGGEIVIPNLYMSTGNEDTTNDDAIVEEVDEIDFIEPDEIVESSDPISIPEQGDDFERRFDEKEFFNEQDDDFIR